ncbi:hypothetical protein [Aequorivita sediminis]|uniref:hypothetical protein n=1 Tax=Aequorivita sediminis TaxID=3073653 RepID=UPI0028B053E9|nr:hypothetical protein [Aequorivita sp. F6058]
MAQQEPAEEIDLGYLFNKINTFFKNLVKRLFSILSFFIKYWIVILILVLIGVTYGYYIDSNVKKTYINEGIVIPNFESVDYLYENINHLNAKISQNDTVFLKNNFPSGYNRIRGIEVEPISDVYNMMTKSREQIDVFRILFQNQDLEKFVTDITTSKYFKYHKVSFSIVGKENTEKVIADVFNYWNNNAHFKQYENVYKKNADLQINEYKKMLSQADSIINSFTSRSKGTQATNSGVIISENNSLPALLEGKTMILNDLLKAELQQSDYTSVIKLVKMDYNVEQTTLSKKIKYPIYLIVIFSLIFLIRNIYRNLKRYSGS